MNVPIPHNRPDYTFKVTAWDYDDARAYYARGDAGKLIILSPDRRGPQPLYAGPTHPIVIPLFKKDDGPPPSR